MDTVPDVPSLDSNDPAVVEVYARRLLALYDLSCWEFGWDKARRRLGLCDHGRQRVSLSVFFVRRNSTAAIVDCLKHEVAHAIVGRGHGHDEVWKDMCRKL